jgi:hypothetical protein
MLLDAEWAELEPLVRDGVMVILNPPTDQLVQIPTLKPRQNLYQCLERPLWK